MIKRFKYNKLRGRIVEIYGSQSAFATALGLSENSLSKKMNGKSGFRQRDMELWCELLKIPLEEAGIYFFK